MADAIGNGAIFAFDDRSPGRSLMEPAWISTSHAGALALLVFALGLPGAAWDRLLRRSLDPSLRAVAAVVLSLATWTVTVYALCALHLFTRPVVAGALAVFAAAWLAMVARDRSAIAPRQPGPSRDFWAVAIPAGAVLGLVLFVALSPRMDYDASAYHLTVPKLYIAHHGFYRIPFNVYSNWPLAMELLYALGLLFHDHVTATALHWAAGLALTLAIVAAPGLLRSPSARLAGWIGAALFWANQAVQWDATVANVDLLHAFFLVAAFLFLFRAAQEPGGRNLHLAVAGVAAGMAAGTKINGVLGVLAVAAAYPLAGAPRPPLRLWFTRFWAPALALAAIWPLKSWVLTGNPVYPFLWRTFGGPDWDGHLTDQLLEWQRSIGMGRGFTDYLLLPFRVILQGAQRYDRFGGEMNAAWIVLIPLTLLLGWRVRFVRRCCGIAALGFVLWAATSQQVRFLFPSFALLSIAAGIALAVALPSIAGRRERMARWLAALAAVALLVASSTGTLRKARHLADVYRGAPASLADADDSPIARFIRESLPQDSLILFLNGNGGFRLDRPYLADSFFQASQIIELLRGDTTEEAIHRRLRQAGVTHVLFGEQDWGVPYPQPLLSMLREQRGVVRLFEGAGGSPILFRLCDSLPCPARAAP